jgi:hypothetical protein
VNRLTTEPPAQFRHGTLTAAVFLGEPEPFFERCGLHRRFAEYALAEG